MHPLFFMRLPCGAADVLSRAKCLNQIARLRAGVLAMFMALAWALTWVSGAHAHGGAEDHSGHAHAAPSTVLQTSQRVPTARLETPTFELVARLYPDELGMYIDDWATNTPVLNADVEIEITVPGGAPLKAKAEFHADHGDYAVADAAVLKALHAAGEHSLVITVSTKTQSDLLSGALEVGHEEIAATGAVTLFSGAASGWMAGGAVIVLLIVGGLWLKRRRA